MSLKYGSQIVDKKQLDNVFKYCFEKKVGTIYIFTDSPDEVITTFSACDLKINEHKYDYIPKLQIWTTLDLKLKIFLETSSEYIFIIYRPLLNKTFIESFYDLIHNSEEKKCCLFLLFDGDLPFTWIQRFKNIPRVYF